MGDVALENTVNVAGATTSSIDRQSNATPQGEPPIAAAQASGAAPEAINHNQQLAEDEQCLAGAAAPATCAEQHYPAAGCRKQAAVGATVIAAPLASRGMGSVS
eukprot:gene6964-7179_t